MAGKIAIDFGTSNTRVAVWDEVKKEGKALFIPDITTVTSLQSDGMSMDFYSIPSLIHYNQQRISIGQKVITGGHADSPTTFKWIKRLTCPEIGLH